MKIYFTCSTAELTKYRDNYFSIRDYLVGKQHILTRDWLPPTDRLLHAGETDINIKDIYKACVDAIRDADAVVVEDTVSNFSTGHQITLALRYKKPTLVLWQGPKHRQFNQMLIHGIDSDILQVSEYTNDTLQTIIQTFLNKYEDSMEKSRFHLVLSGTERMYLDWAQFVKGKSRTKVIRDALQEMMNRDEDYAHYLYSKD